jgi:hypothetical protein
VPSNNGDQATLNDLDAFLCCLTEADLPTLARMVRRASREFRRLEERALLRDATGIARDAYYVLYTLAREAREGKPPPRRGTTAERLLIAREALIQIQAGGVTAISRYTRARRALDRIDEIERAAREEKSSTPTNK